jgi:hypothetical protein
VKAEIADASQSGLVLHTYGYFSAQENSDGSLVYSGPKAGEGYHYVAPDGTAYQRNWTYNMDGSPTGITGHGVTGPVVNGKQGVVLTIIDRASRTYSQTQTEYSVTGGAYPPGPSALGLASSPSEVQQALRSGQVTQKGTTTVNGTPATRRSIGWLERASLPAVRLLCDFRAPSMACCWCCLMRVLARANNTVEHSQHFSNGSANFIHLGCAPPEERP